MDGQPTDVSLRDNDQVIRIPIGQPRYGRYGSDW